MTHSFPTRGSFRPAPAAFSGWKSLGYAGPDSRSLASLPRRSAIRWLESARGSVEMDSVMGFVSGVLPDVVEHCRAEIRAGDEFERSDEPTSELQSLMRISYAVFCL